MRFKKFETGLSPIFRGTNLFELLAPQHSNLIGQLTPLVIGQQDSLLAKFRFENGIFGAKVLDDFLLLSIDPTGKNDQYRLPRFAECI